MIERPLSPGYECQCRSCRNTRRLAAGGACFACDGTGRVVSIEGDMRPCSRCRAEAFDRWAKIRGAAP